MLTHATAIQAVLKGNKTGGVRVDGAASAALGAAGSPEAAEEGGVAED